MTNDKDGAALLREAGNIVSRIAISAFPGKTWADRLANNATVAAALKSHGQAFDAPPSGRWYSDLANAPVACHVLASYFDTLAGEWICEFVQSPPSAPWTHYMLAGTPEMVWAGQPFAGYDEAEDAYRAMIDAAMIDATPIDTYEMEFGVGEE